MLFGHFYKSPLLTVALGFAGALTVAATPTATQSQRDPQARPDTHRVATFEELEPRTAEEIALARFFRDKGHARLTEMSEVNLKEAVDYRPIPPRSGSRPNESASERYFRASICNAEAVFVGRVSDYQVRVTEGGTWLFTTYTVVPVSTVQPLNLADEVSLSIASGVVDVGGKVVTTMTLPLLKNGRHYLFFANRVPGNRGYVAEGRSDEVTWPADADLLGRLNRITQVNEECRKEPRP